MKPEIIIHVFRIVLSLFFRGSFYTLIAVAEMSPRHRDRHQNSTMYISYAVRLVYLKYEMAEQQLGTNYKDDKHINVKANIESSLLLQQTMKIRKIECPENLLSSDSLMFWPDDTRLFARLFQYHGTTAIRSDLFAASAIFEPYQSQLLHAEKRAFD